MIRPWAPKDADAVLFYYFDWTAFCDGEGSDVASYVLAIDDPQDGALVISNDVRSGNVIQLTISAGTTGVEYTVRARVTLANGEIEDESRTLLIEPR